MQAIKWHFHCHSPELVATGAEQMLQFFFIYKEVLKVFLSRAKINLVHIL
jgi:hypothetical protein